MSCTATFCLIEWSLYNPYTWDDIVIRIVSAAGAPAGPGVEMIIRSVGWFPVCFAVPALAIRYGLIFGVSWVAAPAGMLVVNAALDRAGRQTIVARRVAWRVHLVGATVTGLAVASLGYRLTGGYPELRLLVAVSAFCAVTVTVCAVIDWTQRKSRVA